MIPNVCSEQENRLMGCWTGVRRRTLRSARMDAVTPTKESIGKNCCAGIWSTSVVRRPSLNVLFAKSVSPGSPT